MNAEPPHVTVLSALAEKYRKAAEQGIAEAQTNLSVCYRKGRGVLKDEVEAYKWHLLARARGEALKVTVRIEMELAARDRREGQKRAKEWQEQFEAKARGVPKDGVEEMTGEIRKKMGQQLALAKGGNAEAQFELGECYAYGVGVVRDDEEAADWYLKAAEQGHVSAQYNLGASYSSGHGVVEDEVEAYKWYLLAGAQEHEGARMAIKIMEERLSANVIREGENRAKEWEPHFGRNAKAQNDLGRRYFHGQIVEENKERAVKWWRKAAEQGLAEAQYNLGVCFYEGQGVWKDKNEAVKWWRKAAQQGYADAQFWLGECYAEGDYVVKDKNEAVKWYRKAAEQGVAGAQFVLGECYAVGQGAAKDWAESYKWYLLAGAQGNENAEKAKVIMETDLSTEDHGKGQKLAQEWQAQFDAKANGEKSLCRDKGLPSNGGQPRISRSIRPTLR